MQQCGDLGWRVVTQPGELRTVLAAAGERGHFRVIYQPAVGEWTAHWECVSQLCARRKNLVLVADEVDGICSAGTPGDMRAAYWREHKGQMPGLQYLVQYARNDHIAFLAMARAPQDVWRRLTGQSREMLVFRMNEDRELEALRSRLGSATELLPGLGQYEYLRWQDDGTALVEAGR